MATPQGTYHSSWVRDEEVRAYVPNPLPPASLDELGEHLAQLTHETLVEVVRFDEALAWLPSRALVLYSFSRQEAVHSSRIEGSRSTFSDLVLHEVMASGDVAEHSDVGEVMAHVAAYEHGVARMTNDDFPLCNRLLREMHAILFTGGRGAHKMPGEFRTTQNWIGGTRPGDASFVPPPPSEVGTCMSELEKFIHVDDGLPPLIRAGLLHQQFETIHPFVDGNGRVGRLLIALYLRHVGILRFAPLHVSYYIDQHRQTYYDLLRLASAEGEWPAWLEFFLVAVRDSAKHGSALASTLAKAQATSIAEVRAKAGRRQASIVRVMEAFGERPVRVVRQLCDATGLAAPTINAALEFLMELRVVEELTGRQRGRAYGYVPLLELLIERVRD